MLLVVHIPAHLLLGHHPCMFFIFSFNKISMLSLKKKKGFSRLFKGCNFFFLGVCVGGGWSSSGNHGTPWILYNNVIWIIYLMMELCIHIFKCIIVYSNVKRCEESVWGSFVVHVTECMSDETDS